MKQRGISQNGGVDLVATGWRLMLLCLAVVLAACAQVIPVAPQYSGADMTQYFWSGTPYDPAYLVSASGNTQTITDRITLRVTGTTLSFTDGVTPNGVANFTIAPQAIVLDSLQPNNLYAFPGGTMISDNVGVSYVSVKLSFRSLIYTFDGMRLIGGTIGKGVWYSDDDGTNWIESQGAPNMTVTGLAQIPDAPHTIYGVTGDSIYYSLDAGVSFQAIADPYGPHTVISTLVDTAIAAGESSNSGPNVIRIDPNTHQPSPLTPQFSSFAEDSILALAVTSYNTIIAGGYQKMSPANHLFHCHEGDALWSSPPLANSANVYVLVAGYDAVFGGTSNTGIIYSRDQGQTWLTKKSTGSNPSNVTCMTWANLPKLGFAGTSSGDVLSFDGSDTGHVNTYAKLGTPISAITYSPRGYVIVATGQILDRVTNGAVTSIAYTAIQPVTHHGSLTMLNAGTNGLQMNATWTAGYVLVSGQTTPALLTARVTDHLDSLVLPFAIPKAAMKDVFVVRYANENSTGSLNVGMPYWVIYYAHSVGPVIIELLQSTSTTAPPTQLNKAVYDPPF